jgi:hypothetical protein
MKPRERLLALTLLTIAVLGGGIYLFHKLFLWPLQDMDQELVSLQQRVEQEENRVRKIEADKAKLEIWKQLSLPRNVEFSRRQYEIYLSDLLRESSFTTISVASKPAEKSNPVGIYTRLPYTVAAHATLANVVEMLDHFYRTSLLHQIKHLQIQRLTTTNAQAQPGELDIHMTVEALIVVGAEDRQQLLPTVNRRLAVVDVVAALRQAPTGLGLALWAAGPAGPLGPRVLAEHSRHYAAIAKKNIFLGSMAVDRPEVVEVARYVHLTDITQNNTHNPPRCEAFFYDRYNGRMTRLRAEPGFDSFLIPENEGEGMQRGKVVRVDGRELVFQIEDDYYSVHVGQSLDQALRRPLSRRELKDLGLTTVAEKVSTGDGKGSSDD